MNFLPDLSSFLLFLTATIILNLTPGTDVLYIASRSLAHNKLHGLAAAFGISTGIIVHVVIMALGVGEIVKYSPLAFWILKIIGACYLLYLSYKAFVSKNPILVTASIISSPKMYKTYVGGIFTTLLNPKIILFFLTFFPQFIDTSKGNVFLQLIALGSIFIFSGTFINLGYVYIFSFFKDAFLKSSRINKWFQKITGFLFAALAIKMFLAENK